MDVTLTEFMKEQLNLVSTDFKRYMYDKLPWEARLVGLMGHRGVGESTMVLQHIKEQVYGVLPRWNKNAITMELYAVTLVTDLDEQVDLTIQASSPEEAKAIAFSMAELEEIGGIGGYPVSAFANQI